MLLYDILILLACSCVVLLSTYREGSFTFVEKWLVPLDPSRDFANAYGPNPTEQLPKPIVTDVNGDGWSDIVLCTRDPSIKVLTFVSPEQLQRIVVGGTTSLFDVGLNLVAEASLQTNLMVKLGRMPIALATGYISAPLQNSMEQLRETPARKQVIAVVTDGWHVVLYDDALNVLWERTISADLSTQFVGEVALLIGSTPLYEGDHGFVVVGGRLLDNVYDKDFVKTKHSSVDALRRQEPRAAETDGAKKEDPLDVHEEFIDRRGSKFHGADNVEGEAHDLSSSLAHFNFYAFEASSGELRWSHESGDFYEENDAAELRHPQHGAESRGWDAGEMDWRNFQDDLMRSLPHVWHDRDDTTFSLHHFDRKRQGKRDSGRQPVSEEDSVQSAFAYFNSLLGSTSHSAADHVISPNVLVAHSSQGVEAIHLYTGRTLCKLTLEKDIMHLDVNGDHVIDHVGAVAGAHSSFLHLGNKKMQKDAPNCLAFATTGIPPRYGLFNGTICEKVRSKRRSKRRSKKKGKFKLEREAGDAVENREDLLVTRPLPLLRAPRTESLNRIRYDSVFLVNNGMISAYDPSGNQRFHTTTKCSYLSGHSKEGASVPRTRPPSAKSDGSSRRKRRRSTRPSKLTAAEALELQQQEKSLVSSLVAYNIYSDGDLAFSPEFVMQAEALHIDTAQHVLATGEQYLCLLDSSGRVLSESVVPYVPVSEPVVADFNHDGRNDVVLVTTNGIHGYVMEVGVGSYLFTVALVVLMIALLFVLFIKISNVCESTHEAELGSGRRVAEKKKGFSLFDNRRYHRKYH